MITPIHQSELFAGPLEGAASEGTGKPAVQSGTAGRDDLERALRTLMMDVFLDEEPVQRMLEVTALVPPAHRGAWHVVTHTLLARRLDVAAPAVPGRGSANAHTLAWSLSRQWQDPVLAQRWQRLISRLTDRQCRILLSRARRRRSLH